MKATPIAYKNNDHGNAKASKASARLGANKLLGAGTSTTGTDGPHKRAKTVGHATRQQNSVDGCATCCGVPRQAALRPSQALDHWSANVSRPAELPNVGHVLAIALPMHMDAAVYRRPRVNGVLTKTSKAKGPLHAYSLSVVRGEQVPKALDAV